MNIHELRKELEDHYQLTERDFTIIQGLLLESIKGKFDGPSTAQDVTLDINVLESLNHLIKDLWSSVELEMRAHPERYAFFDKAPE